MTVLNPPFTERWMLFNPPGRKAPFYHFVKLSPRGKMYSPFHGVNHLFLVTAAQNFFSYGFEAKCQETGEVIEVENSRPQREYYSFFVDLFRSRVKKPNDKASWGNYVVVKLNSGRICVWKHLKPHKDLVAGQQISQGTILGHIDGSGDAHVPGLGIQVFTEGSLELADKIAFVDVQDRQKTIYSMFYPEQGKSFQKISKDSLTVD